tara:strand:+ start:729 stop:1415 length:687 start_codon:yes stop_codon:yes gene_type:complete
MNTHKRLKLSVAISGIGIWAFCNSALAQQQTSPELDITISVIEEGETPAGFVNRLELPTLSSLNAVSTSTSNAPELEVVEEIESDVNEIVDVATEIGADNVRETISIDGTTNVSVGGGVNVDLGGNPVISLPSNIVDILDPASPLQNTLQDTVDQIGGVIDTVVPSVDSTSGIVDSLEPTSSTNLDSAVQGIVQEQQSLPLDEIPVPPNESPLPIEEISEELREVPLL